MTEENRIFLAHASEDKPRVRLLYDQLKCRGFSPWLDVVDLVPGQNWREEIPKVIRQAAICLICLSKDSIKKRSYVQREFRYAMAMLAEFPPGSIYLIPVRLDVCEVPDLQNPILDLSLKDFHWVDLFEEDGLEKLVHAIEKQIRPTFADFTVFRELDAPWIPEMVRIPPGQFLMGSPEDEPGRLDSEGPQHEVTVHEPFAISRCPITFECYDYFCNRTGRSKPDDYGWNRGHRPAINISYADAEAYCAWLSRITNAIHRLPSEVEWEYACRAGTATAYSFGANISESDANFGRILESTTEAGQFPANCWGLFDMHGNVWEWCEDVWHNSYEGAPAECSAWLTPSGKGRVLRGGSWCTSASSLRSASRSAGAPDSPGRDFGFRCVQYQGLLER